MYSPDSPFWDIEDTDEFAGLLYVGADAVLPDADPLDAEAAFLDTDALRLVLLLDPMPLLTVTFSVFPAEFSLLELATVLALRPCHLLLLPDVPDMFS